MKITQEYKNLQLIDFINGICIFLCYSLQRLNLKFFKIRKASQYIKVTLSYIKRCEKNGIKFQ